MLDIGFRCFSLHPAYAGHQHRRAETFYSSMKQGELPEDVFASFLDHVQIAFALA